MRKYLLIMLLLLGYVAVKAQIVNVCATVTDTIRLQLENYKNGTIEWEESIDLNNWVRIPNASAQIYKFVATQNKYYRGVVKTPQCPPLYSPISFIQLPPVASAGTDRHIGGSTMTLLGNAVPGAIGKWSIIAGENGTITNTGNPTSEFKGKYEENYQLVWTVTNTCGQSKDTVKLLFKEIVAYDRNIIVDKTDSILSTAADLANGIYKIKFSSRPDLSKDSMVLLGMRPDISFLRKISKFSLADSVYTFLTEQAKVVDLFKKGALSIGDASNQAFNHDKSKGLFIYPTRETIKEYKNNKEVKLLYTNSLPTDFNDNRLSKSNKLKSKTDDGILLDFGNTSLTNDSSIFSVSVDSAYVRIQPNFVADYDINWGVTGPSIENIKFGLDNSQFELNYIFTAAIKKAFKYEKKSTWLKKSKDLIFMAGPVPVVVSLEFLIEPTFTASASGIVSYELSKNYLLKSSILLEGADVSHLSLTKSSSLQSTTSEKLTIKASLETAFEIGPEFSCKLYDVLGPYFKLPLKLEAKLCAGASLANGGGGTTGSIGWQTELNLLFGPKIGLKAEILGAGIFDVSKEFVDTLWTSVTPNELALVSGDNQSGASGAELKKPIVVQVKNTQGWPIPFVPVFVSVSGGNGSVPSKLVLSDSKGLVSVNWTIGTTGNDQLKFSVYDCDGDPILNSPVFVSAQDACLAQLPLGIEINSVPRQAVIKVSGGTLPYKYSLDGNGTYTSTQPILPRGKQFVLNTIDANACKMSKSFFIAPFDTCIFTPPVKLSFTNVAATTTLLGSGGTPPYKYTFDDKVSDGIVYDVLAGDYKATVSDKLGCSYSSKISIPFDYTIAAIEPVFPYYSISKVATDTINFAWTCGIYAFNQVYDVYLVKSNSADTLLIGKNLTTTNKKFIGKLNDAQDYTWQIDVKDRFGKVKISKSFYFRTNNAALAIPETPILLVPDNNTTFSNPILELDWKAQKFVFNDQLQVSTDEAFQNIVYYSFNTFNKADFSSNIQGKFYWRVVTSNGDGVKKVSETRNFTITSSGAPIISSSVVAPATPIVRVPVYGTTPKGAKIIIGYSLANTTSFELDVTNKGLNRLGQLGFMWSTAGDPKVGLENTTVFTLVSTNTFTFANATSSHKTTLPFTELGKTYYYRAVGNMYENSITNSKLYFGNLKTYVVPPYLPAVSIAKIDSVGTFEASITDNGGAPIAASGFIWRLGLLTVSDFDIQKDAHNNLGTQSTFKTKIEELKKPGIYYSICAYASNAAGVAYSKVFFVSVPATRPILSKTRLIDKVSSTISSDSISASYLCDRISDGGAPILSQGFVVTDSLGGLISTSEIDKLKTSLSEKILNLKPNTKYTVTPFARNSSGTTNGDPLIFKTRVGSPTLKTMNISGITTNSALSGIAIIDSSKRVLSNSGICWSTSPNPTISDNVNTIRYKDTCVLQNLLPNTSYYVRAYAVSNNSAYYGNTISFKSAPLVVPVVITQEVMYPDGVFINVGGGKIKDDGGSPITAKGLCWSMTEKPTIVDSKVLTGTGNEQFTAVISGITIGGIYHVRAFATNSIGTSYGEDITFRYILKQTLQANEVASLTKTSATVNGQITSKGSTNGTIYTSFAWSIYPNILDSIRARKQMYNYTIGANNQVNDAFSANLIGLKPNTRYYYIALSTSTLGDNNSSERSFKTLPTIANVSTMPVSNIDSAIVLSGANVINDGGSPVTANGVCWSTTPMPSINSSSTATGVGVGSFVASISGLKPGGVYFVRAFATNSDTTSYGNQLSFKYPDSKAKIQTLNVEWIERDRAVTRFKIIEVGSLPVIEMGVCLSEVSNVSVLNTKKMGNYENGIFYAGFNSLKESTTYYYKAYQITAKDTTYGEELSVKTHGLPIIKTDSVFDVTSTSFSVKCSLIYDGGTAITNMGIRVADLNPAKSWDRQEYVINTSVSSGSFTVNNINLSPGSSFLLAAYAQNAYGEVLGEKLKVNTKPSLPSLTINTSYDKNLEGINVDFQYFAQSPNDSASAYGVCWSNTTDAPSITDGSNTNKFIIKWETEAHTNFAHVLNLEPLSTYYFRSFGTNKAGTAYSTSSKVYTRDAYYVHTNPITEIGTKTAVSGGNTGTNLPINVSGICWSADPLPTLANSFTSIDAVSANNADFASNYASTMTGLFSNTRYYVRAYISHQNGTVYGNQISFVTPAPNDAALSTATASNITAFSATAGGTITDDGGANVQKTGVCWAITENPTVDNFSITNESVTTTFASEIKGLKAQTTYFARAFANNGKINYGNQISFTTPAATIALITSNEVSNITSKTAVCGGTITNNGGTNISDRGICWGTTENPTIIANNKAKGAGDSFSSQLTGLVANTNYFVRAYAVNQSGTAYGEQKSFMTSPAIPVLTTNTITNTRQTSARSGGIILSMGNSDIIAKGICWSTSANATTANNVASSSASTSILSYGLDLNNLSPNTTYFARSYAQNTDGIAYGNEISFATLALPTEPIVNTAGITNIGKYNAQSGGSVSKDGGRPVLAMGVCWSTTAMPTIADNTTKDFSSGSVFNSIISGLRANTTYHIRAYAKNEVGVGYGKDSVFTTLNSPPTVVASDMSSITSTTAACGGTVTDDGGLAITARGICWSINTNPQISDNFTTNDTGMGAFNGLVNNLKPNVTYHIRAYATNSVGTNYSLDQVFTSLPSIPQVKVAPASKIATTYAQLSGELVSDGGMSVDTLGICWSVNKNPSIADQKVFLKGNIFVQTIDNLMPSTKYYARAFAHNKAGLAYSDTISFKTKSQLAKIRIDSMDLFQMSGNPIQYEFAPAITEIDNGGSEITKFGLCMDTSPMPVVGEYPEGTDGNDFNWKSSMGKLSNQWFDVLNLPANTHYYYRGYVITSAGLSYSDQKELTTPPDRPQLSKLSLVSRTQKSITLTCTVLSDGGGPIVKRLITYFSYNLGGYQQIQISDTSKVITFTINDILSNDTWIGVEVSNFATSGVTGDNFQTLPFTLPTLKTIAFTKLSQKTLTSGGEIVDDGGATISASGVCWSTTPNPTVSNFITTDRTLSGVYASSITGLLENTTYYARAYATNSQGTSYGNQIVFKTLPPLTPPILSSVAISSISQLSATSGGIITSDGGSPITQSGVCWSTVSGPTIAKSLTTDGTNSGTYASLLTNLNAKTKYFVRAYATNSLGTSYGAEFNFITLPAVLPSVGISPIVDVGVTTAIITAQIVGNGGSIIRASGLCWSTVLNPTIADDNNASGSRSGIFSLDLTNLTPGTIYHVRSFAINAVGTAYGEDATFTTKTSIVVGDKCFGGVVAYVFKAGDAGFKTGQFHGVVTALDDLTTSTTWAESSLASGVVQAQFGAGSLNTKNIVSFFTDSINSAALQATNFRGGSYTDWYLPSTAELLILFNNKTILGNFALDSYWTSTEKDKLNSISINFNTGSQDNSLRTTKMKVRPIRTF